MPTRLTFSQFSSTRVNACSASEFIWPPRERRHRSPIEAFRKFWIAIRVVFSLDVVGLDDDGALYFRPCGFFDHTELSGIPMLNDCRQFLVFLDGMGDLVVA